ncbi:peptidyl-prolyl cis-trans isomerase [Shewanella psychropiezotolerans]|uniref:Peptidyl-prolyl cis-trans isomerase n=1 Tax=Shewanella psychropiezotolerans TaxID=2593655 RepID=A0ABX5X2U6_9GAMM|nr:peptidyl-prolyl cis-trans isomerase [Shewanella sp. YLB-07]MPY23436.1 peptidyl-prolyl cis-trans isomerase [Shewanella sp. YLB-07]QDO85516.1 peptidyl-prolyl cis-trans isomerase [Shewanella psychropiezotolerans]QDO85517.1 peptidyl-prolyl cis-trans isomerase [Shewanella psychropiezotolerans]
MDLYLPFVKACFTGELITPQLVKTLLMKRWSWHVIKVLYRT